MFKVHVVQSSHKRQWSKYRSDHGEVAHDFTQAIIGGR